MLNNKNRILRLQQYLYHFTDEQHPVTTGEIIAMFSDETEQINRKTVKADIQTLIEEGADIVRAPGRENAWFMASREFELPELKLLIDAVSASQFINKKQSRTLIEKLKGLASEKQAEGIVRHLYTADTVKATNKQILYTVDAVNQAINEEKKLSFKYRDFLPNGQETLRHNGELYICSPYGLVWNEGHYYMVCWSEKHKAISQFRVDRMQKPQVMNEKALKAPSDFNMNSYVETKFGMYGGQEAETVTLECRNEYMNHVIDHFGEGIKTRPAGEDHFRTEVQISASPVFYAWLFTFHTEIRPIAPQKVVDEYRSMLKAALEQYD